jgi:transposase
MLQPVRIRTWAPRGETPIQHPWDRRDRLSVIAAISVSPVRHRLGLHHQIHQQNIRGPLMDDFLNSLHRQLRRRIILVWDRLGAHRSSRAHLEQTRRDGFEFEWLPAYAPELDPVEQCWNHAKCTDLANLIPNDLGELQDALANSLESQRRNPDLLRSYFQFAGLDL